MIESSSNKTIFSLLEVMQSIQKMVSTHYINSYWIKAEMNKLNHYSHSGHCYPELVEKEGERVIAQVRATLWKDDYHRINAQFESTVKEPLKDGIKILFCARVHFDPVYGFTLRILDIDSSYSLGDLEKEKAETIALLKREQIFNSNKRLSMELLPQRIAVISVETSKGYSDFMNILSNNSWGYRFFTMLFPALLQGEKAVQSIHNQLLRIKKVQSHFDAVVIVRGGGGDVGLSCYNNLLLARAIAQFPLPILTGIGHSTNETVAELISFKNAITPTELADYLIQQFHNFSIPVSNALDSISRNSRTILSSRRTNFNIITNKFKTDTRSLLVTEKHRISKKTQSIIQQSMFVLQTQRESQNQWKQQLLKNSTSWIGIQRQMAKSERQQLSKSTIQLFHKSQSELEKLDQKVHLLDPKNILKRGYSITLMDGKTITSPMNVPKGSTITTILANGTILSKTISTNNQTNEE